MCEMNLLIHSKTSTAATLKFGKEQVIYSQTLQHLRLLIDAEIKVNPF